MFKKKNIHIFVWPQVSNQDLVLCGSPRNHSYDEISSRYTGQEWEASF